MELRGNQVFRILRQPPPPVKKVIAIAAAWYNFLNGSKLLWNNKKVPLTFVTASDTSHAKSLENLLASITHHIPRAQVIVYDLGMTKLERADLEKSFPSAQIECFPYQKFPDYFDIRVEAGQYAWKAQCVEMVASQTTGDLIWIDAGSVITGKLSAIKKVLASRGVFAIRASGPATRWTHPLTFSALNAGEAEYNRDQLAAGFIGFSLESPLAQQLISSWALHSRDREVIAPLGSSRDNHRQDQAVFSLLMYSILASSTPKFGLSFIGFWPKFVKQYLTNQDVD